MRTLKVVIQYVYPAIPTRDFDWHAIRDGYEPGDPIGYGPTPVKALENLLESEQM